MKKKAILLLAVLFLASCASFQKAYVPPSFHLESPQPVVLAQLTLDQRIAFEDGWSNLKRGNVEKARKEFLKLGENNAFYHLGEGYCRLYEQNPEGAETSFEKALEMNPELVSARVGLAVIYEQQGNEDKLFLELREILKKEPEHSWAKPGYEDLKNRKSQTLIKEAEAFLNQNKKEEAKESFLKALFYFSNSKEAHWQLARIYRSEKKYSQALNHYEVLSNLSPADKQIFREYAETLMENEDLSKSLDVYEKLRNLSPGDQQIKERIEFLKNQLGIVELPSMYDEIPKLQAITRQDLAAILAVKFHQFLSEPASSPIIVDIATSWASRFIIRVAAIPLMDIYDNHTFEPGRVVTRAELAETFYRLINYLSGKGKKLFPLIPTSKIQISDIPEDNIYYLPAVQMVAYQLMELSAQKRFVPDAPVSGIEALRTAEFLLNLIK
jgi:tetratricopeptide (TPR) repeat protein